MKTRLDELTAAEFIELVCGNKDVLLGKHEMPNADKLTIALRNIIMEYRSIADSGGNAAYFKRVEELIRARLAVTVYAMCQNLVALERFGEVREILIAAGLPAEKWNDKRIESEVHIQLQKGKRAFEEADKGTDEGEDDARQIRDAFNGLIASMMAQFKFQIDVSQMMAPVFAHLVARYHAEIKAMKKAMKLH